MYLLDLNSNMEIHHNRRVDLYSRRTVLTEHHKTQIFEKGLEDASPTPRIGDNSDSNSLLDSPNFEVRDKMVHTRQQEQGGLSWV